ncbi:MAG: helix-turn-helix domain-containing protein [Burkholderiaceae bacterium]
MDTAQVRSIASLKRGLEILSLVASRDGLALHQLHTASGVPKASLLRILKTLMEHGLVHRRSDDGAYVPAQASEAGRASHAGPTALPQALPGLLKALRECLPWPSDVAIARGVKMRVIDSNRLEYGRVWQPSVVGEEVDMIDSAMGRAYLAFLPLDACRALVEQGLSGGGTRARRREAIESELALTRRRGFGQRDGLYAGPDANHGRQLSAIAVPILGGKTVLGCVSCVWNRRTSSQSEVLELALAHLVRLAAMLGASVVGEAG